MVYSCHTVTLFEALLLFSFAKQILIFNYYCLCFKIYPDAIPTHYTLIELIIFIIYLLFINTHQFCVCVCGRVCLKHWFLIGSIGSKANDNIYRNQGKSICRVMACRT